MFSSYILAEIHILLCYNIVVYGATLCLILLILLSNINKNMAQYHPQKLIPLVEKMILEGQLNRTLYTYMPVDSLDERVIPILRECKLWFSSPASFNDPFDCKIYPRTLSDEELAAHLSSYAKDPSDVYNRLLVGIRKCGPDLVRNTIDNVMNQSGVKCFTPNNKNILMWSHYTNSHKGICLEFDILTDPEFFVSPINVVYSEDYPDFDYRDDSFALKILSTKSKVWEYEQEVRVYKLHSGYYHFSPLSLKSVIFGCYIPEEKQAIIIETIRQNKNLHHVKILKCSTNPQQFKLDINPL